MEVTTEHSIEVARSTLRLIPDKENFKRKDEIVEDGIVRSTFAFRLEANGPRYEKAVTFDFRDCTFDEVCLFSTTNGAVVYVQRVLRDMGTSAIEDPNVLAHVNVKSDILEAPARTFASPEDRARSNLRRLSPEMRAAILAEFMPTDEETSDTE
jgi:hypothetical protein